MTDWLDRFHRMQEDTLPGVLGLVWTQAGPKHVAGRLTVERRHLAPNGFLHAASVIALADSACGFGCLASLPPDASGFTTIELKSNFLGTAREGSTINCDARLLHGGRSTQVWDATVADDQGRPIALFRCTQMILRSAGEAERPR